MTGGRLHAGGILLAVLVVGCTGAAPPPTGPPPQSPHADYQLSPLTGYPFGVPQPVAQRLAQGFQALRDGDPSAARSAADQLLLRDPLLHPAWVLRAQCDLELGLSREAVTSLLPITRSLPEFTAAQLALGRAAELDHDVVTAYGAFLAAAGESPLARARAAELLDRALVSLRQRVLDELERGRTEIAQESLTRLELWAPLAEATQEARLEIAQRQGDLEAALAAARHLAAVRPDDTELRERRAALEVEVGDPRVGMKIFRELAEASPDDPELADLMAWSEFRWRLGLMPSEVQELVRRPELSRADMAVLLYWMFPEVRFSRAGEGRIATDVLEHPMRDRIVRVVNLGLMQLDPNLHRFAPERSSTRIEALNSLLGLLVRAATPLACVSTLELNPRPTPEAICRVAVACGLLTELDDCRPLSSISGSEVLNWIRRTQEALEAE